MKTKGLFLVFAVLLSTALIGQTDGDRKLFFGGQGGVNVSRFQTELDSTTTGARLGWQAGAMVRYGGRFFAEAQINLGQSSAELVRKDTSMLSIRSKVYRTFVSVPVMAGYKIFSSEDGTSNFRIMAGAEATMMLKTKLDENFFYVEKDDFEPSSFSAIAGIGADFWFIRLDLAIHYGFTPLLRNDDKSKNIMGSFNIGVIF
ncbi:MAG: PorT family protein [Bacteroidales bacterium]|nr:PorT family protein [Bacteroidales bacterium]